MSRHERRASAGKQPRPFGRAAALALALALGAPAAALADEPASEPEAKPPAKCVEWGPIGANDCVQEVLESEEFSTVEKVELWLPKEGETKEVESGSPSGFLLWLANAGATLLRVGAWLSVAAFVIVLGLVIARSLRDRERVPAAAPVVPSVRFGLDLRPESLPADVIAAARERFAAGDAQGALSLLYRGALVHLVRGAGLRIPASATEGECERAARAAVDAGLAGDFSALTRAWTFCAYAHQAPQRADFDELCARWDARLGAGA
jgi:hypothetical protein